MLPQHLVCKYELNCEYCNIPLAKNKAPSWWSDKIETCRSVLKCFMRNYMCIRWSINWSDSTEMHGATIRFMNYANLLNPRSSVHLEKLVVPQLVKKSQFYKTRTFASVLTTASHCLSWVKQFQTMPSCPVYLRYVLRLIPTMNRSSKRSVSFWLSHQKLCGLLLSPTTYAI